MIRPHQERTNDISVTYVYSAFNLHFDGMRLAINVHVTQWTSEISLRHL